jgi:3'(2'), 5'-bisphosphate nucleotidase
LSIAYGQLIDELAEAAREAGEAIRTVVRRGFEVESKHDMSPVTEADRAAELIILAALARAAPGVPVIAEEEVAAGRIPAHDDLYFLVDPLDGTKEFVRGGDDYTVNIALIEGREPRLGVVFAPATGLLHAGCVGEGAWVDDGKGRLPIETRERGLEVTAVASKSHLNQATIDYLEAAVGVCDYVTVGSSLKFCILAEGKADIYPRASPTREWDTAAGHAVLLAARGLVDSPDGTPLHYGKRAFVNRAFVATGGWKAPPIDPFLEPFSGGGDLPEGV